MRLRQVPSEHRTELLRPLQIEASGEGRWQEGRDGRPLLVTLKADKISETPAGIAYEAHIVSIRASTVEWQAKASFAMASNPQRV
jgi:hypothetical protein